MKLLITTIAAVLLVGCGQSDHQHSHDDDHSHAEGDHHHAEGDIDDHDKELKAAEPVAEAAKPEPPTGKAPNISIHDAAAKGNIEAIKQHLAADTDVNANGYRGFTPLHYAARNGHKEIVELLIAKGADVNVKIVSGPSIGNTPLDLAASKMDNFPPKDKAAKKETADLLRKHGGKTGEELK